MNELWIAKRSRESFTLPSIDQSIKIPGQHYCLTIRKQFVYVYQWNEKVKQT